MRARGYQQVHCTRDAFSFPVAWPPLRTPPKRAGETEATRRRVRRRLDWLPGPPEARPGSSPASRATGSATRGVGGTAGVCSSGEALTNIGAIPRDGFQHCIGLTRAPRAPGCSARRTRGLPREHLRPHHAVKGGQFRDGLWLECSREWTGRRYGNQEGRCSASIRSPTADTRGWAALVQRICAVDLRTYPTCRGPLRFVAVITQVSAINQILEHLARRNAPR